MAADKHLGGKQMQPVHLYLVALIFSYIVLVTFIALVALKCTMTYLLLLLLLLKVIIFTFIQLDKNEWTVVAADKQMQPVHL